jgi:outer membrane immunogenic protein
VKKFILLGLSLIVLNIGGSALAADVAVEAPIYPSYGVPVITAYNWTGFYIGANVGGHFAKDDIIDVNAPISVSPRGILGGLQVGYNWQVGRLFMGLESDGNWLGGAASGSQTVLIGPPVTAVITNDSKAQFLMTVRPRVGVALDRWLIYVTGGLAFETFITNDTFVSPVILTGTDRRVTRTGETIGGGIEYAVLDSWTLRIEYLYITFGSYDVNINAPIVPITVQHQYTDNVARIGLNYRFPVYWRY